MLIIHHRRNSIELINQTPKNFGVEIDIRTYKNELIVNHEPYENGIKLMELLKFYNHQFLILNTKEEGLEKKILKMMLEFDIKSFFLLDQSFPFLVKTLLSGEKRCAIRVSEYESVKTALSLSGLAEWIWIDVFNKFPISKSDYINLKDAGFKLCLVSPELQQHSFDKVMSIKKFLKEKNIVIDAVCTKFPSYWID